MAQNYFPHDLHSRHDPKLQKIEIEHGRDGRMLYWDLIELLHESGGYLLTGEIKTYAFALRTEPKLIHSILEDFGLFKFEGEVFYSARVLRNIERQKELTQKRMAAGKASAEKRANQNTVSTDVQQMFNNCSTDVQQLDKTKLDKTKVKKKDITIPPVVNVPFEDFWEHYDKKTGDKRKLLPKWNALTDEERTKAMEHINQYKQATPDKQYRKNPETYLNNKSFNDEVIPTKGVQNARPQIAATNGAIIRGGSIADIQDGFDKW